MKTFDRILEQYRLIEQHYKFRRSHGYSLDLDNPSSFSEKIIWRKVYDRNPLFPVLADKYRSREYVLEKLGREAGKKIIVPLLFVTEDPREIPFDDLPEEYILKPNHGSGWYIIVDAQHPVSPKKVISKCMKWLNKTYGQSKLEWAYSQIKPCIIVEKLLKDRLGKMASDFKFFVFNGKVEWVYVVQDRFGLPSKVPYDRDFKRMDIVYGEKYEAVDIQKPTRFEEMIEIAEKLAQSLDFVRVDLYDADGAIFFGELTLYPGSGSNRLVPTDFDFYMGEKWNLNRKQTRRLKK
ncbi:MAG: hypothetical protein JW755_04570 [Candidatus Aminicenantes bacterium]|nr:hypothetical protein [Candidatus Aminicenantes bacterium]